MSVIGSTTFGQCLAEFRAKAGLSQSRLSFDAGLDHSFISRLESGNRVPSRETIAILAETLLLDRFDAARLYRAGGYWPPSLVGAAWVATRELDSLEAGEPIEFHQSPNDGIWDDYARMEDVCEPLD